MLSPPSGVDAPSSPRPRRAGAAGLVLAAATVLGACSDPTGLSGPVAVEVTGAEEPLTALGETADLEAVVLNARGVALDLEVTWSSDDPSVASVDPHGTLTARGPGSTGVTAAVGDVAGTTPVSVEPRPSAMDPARGNAQEGTAGRPLADSVAVEVRDARGSGVEGASVHFRVISGGGSVSPNSQETDANGRAPAEWTLGEDASADHELGARVELDGEALEAVFEAEAVAGEPAMVRSTGGDGQEGYALEPLSEAVAVAVEDEFGNPVPEAEVRWEPETEGGEVEPNPALTDEAGAAEGTWTPGDADGLVELEARVDELEPAVVHAEVEPNALIVARLAGEGSSFGTAAVGREAFRWPRVAQSAYADGTSSADAEGAGSGRPSRSLLRLSRDGSVSSEPAFLEGRGSWDGESRGGPDPHVREVLVTVREGVVAAPGRRARLARAPELAPDLASRLREWARDLHPGRAEVLGASPVLGTARVRVPPGEDPERFKEGLRQREDVQRVTWNRPFRAFEEPGTDPLSGRAPVNPLQLWHYRALDLERAWDVERGSGDVVVAVVDDGFRFDHPWLEDRWTGRGYSFVEEEELNLCSGGTVSSTGHGDGPGPDAVVPERYRWVPSQRCVGERIDRGGHGMQVAGVVAGGSEGQPTGGGVAPEVSVLPVRTLNVAGVGSAYTVAQGILYAAGLPADDGRGGTVAAEGPADIINLSLGSPSPDSLVHEAVREATGAGALVVAAAGNQGESRAFYPAGHPEVVAVSAVDPAWELAWYSNHGSAIELTAPGGVTEPGSDHAVWTAEWDFRDERPAMGAALGTSMAAPHVAGVAALLLSMHPGMGAEEVRRRMRDHAFPLGPGTPNTLYGHGLVDAYWTLTDGRGRPAEAHAVLYDAETGEAVDRVPMDGTAEARFARLEPGRYWVYGGAAREEEGLGLPPNPWGAAGPVGFPDTLVVEGSGLQETSLSLGPPVALQDGAAEAADALPPGGYLIARLTDPGAGHRYTFPVPEAGRYIVETTGVHGACGLAGQLDTEMEVLDASGTPLASSSAVDEDAGNYCSYLELDLDAGEYTVRITSHDGEPGFYRIVAREAPGS